MARDQPTPDTLRVRCALGPFEAGALPEAARRLEAILASAQAADPGAAAPLLHWLDGVLLGEATVCGGSSGADLLLAPLQGIFGIGYVVRDIGLRAGGDCIEIRRPPGGGPAQVVDRTPECLPQHAALHGVPVDVSSRRRATQAERALARDHGLRRAPVRTGTGAFRCIDNALGYDRRLAALVVVLLAGLGMVVGKGLATVSGASLPVAALGAALLALAPAVVLAAQTISIHSDDVLVTADGCWVSTAGMISVDDELCWSPDAGYGLALWDRNRARFAGWRPLDGAGAAAHLVERGQVERAAALFPVETEGPRRRLADAALRRGDLATAARLSPELVSERRLMRRPLALPIDAGVDDPVMGRLQRAVAPHVALGGVDTGTPAHTRTG